MIILKIKCYIRKILIINLMKFLINLFLALFCVISFSQENKFKVTNLYGVQIGFHSIDLYGEYSISNTSTIKTSFNLSGYYYDKSLSLIPVLNLSPRWYYNFNKRNSDGKNTQNNSANYLSLNMNYTPNWFTISKKEINRSEFLQFIPTWGLRRNINHHLNYEVSAGIGYERNLTKEKANLGVDVNLKLDYNF